ncbi:uncharacterized protein EV420DRAFT_1226415, partial [Desarmillaria tabescens]
DEWLLIYDNANHSDIHLLQKYLPFGQRGNILITSRNPYLKYITNHKEIAVLQMNLEEAINLLLNTSGLNHSMTNDTLANAIVIKLGFIPLAINLAGSSIHCHYYTISEYVKCFDKNRKNIL